MLLPIIKIYFQGYNEIRRHTGSTDLSWEHRGLCPLFFLPQVLTLRLQLLNYLLDVSTLRDRQVAWLLTLRNVLRTDCFMVKKALGALCARVKEGNLGSVELLPLYSK